MARGLRSSRAKINKSKLRAKTFGPVEDARLERLSKKLAEISSNSTAKEPSMDVDATADIVDEQQDVPEGSVHDDMKIDNGDSMEPKPISKKKTKTRKEARKIKRDSKRKPRNLIAFKTKTRNPNTKQRRPPRI